MPRPRDTRLRDDDRSRVPHARPAVADRQPRALTADRGPRIAGTVQRLVRDRGFGFLVDADGRTYFFHASGLEGVVYDELVEGQAMSWASERTEKGLRAEQVREEAGTAPPEEF